MQDNKKNIIKQLKSSTAIIINNNNNEDKQKKLLQYKQEDITKKRYFLLYKANNSTILVHIKNLRNYTRLQYLNISYNANKFSINELDVLIYLKQLIKLDLSSNNLDQLPHANIFKQLKCLKILYLHCNSYKDINKLESLQYLTNLIYLTIYQNPLSMSSSTASNTIITTTICPISSPSIISNNINGINSNRNNITYSINNDVRKYIINKCHLLKCLDFHIISDKEKLNYLIKLHNSKITWENLEIKVKWPYHTYDKDKDKLDDNQVLKSVYGEISYINNIHSKLSEIIKIQKCYRGHLIRKNKKYIRIGLKNEDQYNHMKTLIKRWKLNIIRYKKLREFLIFRGKVEYLSKSTNLKTIKLHDIIQRYCEILRARLKYKKGLEKAKYYLRSSYMNIYSINKTADIYFNIFNYKAFYIKQADMRKFQNLIEQLMSKLLCCFPKYNEHDLFMEIFGNREHVANIMTLYLPDNKSININGFIPLLGILKTYMKSKFKICDSHYAYKRKNIFYEGMNKINIKQKIKYVLNTCEKQKYLKLNDKLNCLYEQKYCQLIRITINNANILNFIIRHLQSWNKTCQQNEVILFYLDEGIKRISSAIKIQSAYRKYKNSITFNEGKNFWDAIKRYRAAIFIQRWSRKLRFTNRMYFLTELNIYLQRFSGRALYIEEDVYVHLMGIIVVIDTMRMKLKDQNIKILVDPRNFNHIAIRINTDLPYRSFLPYWIKGITHQREKIQIDCYEGDAMHLLHLGTLIKKKVKNGVRYLKIMFKDKESALYTASIIALKTFTNRNSGFFIKPMDKKLFKNIKEGLLIQYYNKIFDIYDVHIHKEINNIQGINNYIKYNESSYKKNFYDNCGFFFSKSQADFKTYATTHGENYINEIKVRSSVKIKLKTNNLKDKLSLSTFKNANDIIYFIPYLPIYELQLQIFRALNINNGLEDEIPSSRDSIHNFFTNNNNNNDNGNGNNQTDIMYSTIKFTPDTFMNTQIKDNNVTPTIQSLKKSRPPTSSSPKKSLSHQPSNLHENFGSSTKKKKPNQKMNTSSDLKAYLVHHTNLLEMEFKKKMIFMHKLHSFNLKQSITNAKEKEITKLKEDVKRKKENTFIKRRIIQQEKIQHLEAMAEKNYRENSQINDTIKQNEQKTIEDKRNNVERLKYEMSVEMKIQNQIKPRIKPPPSLLIKKDCTINVEDQPKDKVGQDNMENSIKKNNNTNPYSRKIASEKITIQKNEQQTPDLINLNMNSHRNTPIKSVNELSMKKNCLPDVTPIEKLSKLHNIDLSLSCHQDDYMIKPSKNNIRYYEVYMYNLARKKILGKKNNEYQLVNIPKDLNNTEDFSEKLDTSIIFATKPDLSSSMKIPKGPPPNNTDHYLNKSYLNATTTIIHSRNASLCNTREMTPNRDYNAKVFLRKGERGLNLKKMRYSPIKHHEDSQSVESKTMTNFMNLSSIV